MYQLYIILWRVQELTTVGSVCSINFYVIVFLMLGSVPFQFLVVTSICTNCALLVWLYDQEGKWKIEPGLAAILVMEHVLLLIKFGFSRFVPEVISNYSCERFFTSRLVTHVNHLMHVYSLFLQEPAWVRANRVKKATEAENMCSKQLLRNISGGERAVGASAVKKTE